MNVNRRKNWKGGSMSLTDFHRKSNEVLERELLQTPPMSLAEAMQQYHALNQKAATGEPASTQRLNDMKPPPSGSGRERPG
jgi:hypothetical protein